MPRVGLFLVAVGLAALSWFSIQLIEASRFQREQSEALRAATTSAVPTRPRVPHDGLIGRLEIPRVHLSAMVVEGDDAATLEKAVGHLPETALPWEQGNTALAGHRDTFFRPLRKIRIGDEIRLTSPRGVFTYRVREAFVTEPDNVGVLAPSSGANLITLVTCYPFGYIGPAPKRYVVQAEQVRD